jgi:hypothetical protein
MDQRTDIQNAKGAADDRSFGQTIEIITKVGALLFFGCYIAGLLILNLHLAQYGIFHLGFLQIDYVMSGALWLFLVGAAYSIIVHSKAMVSSAFYDWRAKKNRWWVALRIALLVFTTVIFGDYILKKVSVEKISYREASTWAIYGNLLSTALVLMWIRYDLRHSIRRFIFNKIDNEQQPVTGHVIGVFDRTILILGLITTYALYTFPKLSPAFGGGKQQKAELIAKLDKLPILTNLGLPVQQEGQKLEPVEIIFEDADFFYVLPLQNTGDSPSPKALRIRKDMIDGAVYISTSKTE